MHVYNVHVIVHLTIVILNKEHRTKITTEPYHVWRSEWPYICPAGVELASEFAQTFGFKLQTLSWSTENIRVYESLCTRLWELWKSELTIHTRNECRCCPTWCAATYHACLRVKNLENISPNFVVYEHPSIDALRNEKKHPKSVKNSIFVCGVQAQIHMSTSAND